MSPSDDPRGEAPKRPALNQSATKLLSLSMNIAKFRAHVQHRQSSALVSVFDHGAREDDQLALDLLRKIDIDFQVMFIDPEEDPEEGPRPEEETLSRKIGRGRTRYVSPNPYNFHCPHCKKTIQVTKV